MRIWRVLLFLIYMAWGITQAGAFSPNIPLNTLQAAEEAGLIPVTLGHRILRTETAAMVILSWLIFILEK